MIYHGEQQDVRHGRASSVALATSLLPSFGARRGRARTPTRRAAAGARGDLRRGRRRGGADRRRGAASGARLGAAVQRERSGGADRPQGAGTAVATERGTVPRWRRWSRTVRSLRYTAWSVGESSISASGCGKNSGSACRKQTLSRELRAMGYRKLSARPRHHAQAAGAIETFKKTGLRQWRRSRASRGLDPADIEIWFADEARIGQKNKITRRWARRGSRPSAPSTSAPPRPISSVPSARAEARPSA